MKLSKLFALFVLTSAFSSISARAGDFTSKMQDDYNTSNSYSLWHGGYDDTDFEVVVGYVNKSWICTYEGFGTQREDFFGDPVDKFLHGCQFGALYTPSFDWGLGLRTGLFFEGYVSRSNWITSWCHHFSEADLYIPLHATFRIPFQEKCALNFLGGMGFQWAMAGNYYRQVGTAYTWRRPIPIYDSRKHRYGNGWPEPVNWQAEVGLNFRISMFSFTFAYSFGLTDHKIQNSFDGETTYVTATRSRQDKMQASIAFIF